MDPFYTEALEGVEALIGKHNQRLGSLKTIQKTFQWDNTGRKTIDLTLRIVGKQIELQDAFKQCLYMMRNHLYAGSPENAHALTDVYDEMLQVDQRYDTMLREVLLEGKEEVNIDGNI